MCLKKKREPPYLFSVTKIARDEMTSGICSREEGESQGAEAERRLPS